MPGGHTPEREKRGRLSSAAEPPPEGQAMWWAGRGARLSACQGQRLLKYSRTFLLKASQIIPPHGAGRSHQAGSGRGGSAGGWGDHLPRCISNPLVDRYCVSPAERIGHPRWRRSPGDRTQVRRGEGPGPESSGDGGAQAAPAHDRHHQLRGDHGRRADADSDPKAHRVAHSTGPRPQLGSPSQLSDS